MCFLPPEVEPISSVLSLTTPRNRVTGERRLGKYEDTRDPTPPKEGQLPKAETEEQEEEEDREIVEVGQIVTTTGECRRTQLPVMWKKIPVLPVKVPRSRLGR
ncbi:uncharacterized protein LOC143943350 [Lithobates pipiens]